MSTRNLHGIGTTRTTTDSPSSSYLDRGLQLVGLFFFINGIYVAFFSDSLFTTFGYYFVVIAAICAVLSRIVSPENPLISPETQESVRQMVNRSKTPRTARSRRPPARRRGEFDIRRYLRRITRTIGRIDVGRIDIGRITSRDTGRDRL